MKFQKKTQAELQRILARHSPDAYPGGSNRTDLAAFKKYVSGKKVTHRPTGERGPAREVFETCYWRRTDNAEQAENKLLKVCGDKSSCTFNVHRKSNPSDDDGFVYVLVE